MHPFHVVDGGPLLILSWDDRKMRSLRSGNVHVIHDPVWHRQCLHIVDCRGYILPEDNCLFNYVSVLPSSQSRRPSHFPICVRLNFPSRLMVFVPHTRSQPRFISRSNRNQLKEIQARNLLSSSAFAWRCKANREQSYAGIIIERKQNRDVLFINVININANRNAGKNSSNIKYDIVIVRFGRLWRIESDLVEVNGVALRGERDFEWIDEVHASLKRKARMGRRAITEYSFSK